MWGNSTLLWKEYINFVPTCWRKNIYFLFKAPNMVPKIQIGKIWSSRVELTWDEIPLEERNGMIKDYKIFYWYDKGPAKGKLPVWAWSWRPSWLQVLFSYLMFSDVGLFVQLWLQIQKRGRWPWKISAWSSCMRLSWPSARSVGAWTDQRFILKLSPLVGINLKITFYTREVIKLCIYRVRFNIVAFLFVSQML